MTNPSSPSRSSVEPLSAYIRRTRAWPEISWEEIAERVESYELALTEIAEDRHGFHRPAGAIARNALAGLPLPNLDGSCPHEWSEWKSVADGVIRDCDLCGALEHRPEG